MRSDMENWKSIRQDVLVNGLSQRAACAKYMLGWHTLKKILAHAEPSGYRQSQARPRRVLATVLPIIQEILEADQKAPKKQRHTAKRIFERLNAPVGCNLVHSLWMLGHVVAPAGISRSKKVITLPLHVIPHRTTAVCLCGVVHIDASEFDVQIVGRTGQDVSTDCAALIWLPMDRSCKLSPGPSVC